MNNTDSSVLLPPLVTSKARRWQPWLSGPKDLVLVCDGTVPARLAYALYRHWPLPRGRRPFLRALARLPFVRPYLRDTLFCSRFGGRFRLDMTTPQFHYLSGLFPPEPLELSIMARLVEPGDVFVDVGANVGLYLAHLSGRVGPTGRYYAFEPDPHHFRFLKDTFAHTPGLTLINAAASDRTGISPLTKAGTLEATLKFSADLAAAGDGTVAEVPVRRLDETLDLSVCRGTSVVKIDVEGHEAAVIRGMSGLVEKGFLPLMQIEYLPDREEGDRAGINTALKQFFGDRLTYLGISGRLGTLCPISLDEEVAADVLNILAVPAACEPRLRRVFADQA